MSDNGRPLFLMSPSYDQSLAIAMFLRAKSKGRRLVGVSMPGEERVGPSSLYDEIVELSAIAEAQHRLHCVPTGSASTRYLLERRDVTLGEVTLSRAALRFFDKPWALELARHAEVPVPRTWLNRHEANSFPLFFKARMEGSSTGCGLAATPADLPAVADQELIFQEFIPDPGTYGVGFIAEAGELKLTHTHFEAESYPEAGGSAITIELFHDDRLVDYARRIVSASGYSGWGLAEFKYSSRRNDFVFMELNAKFWASCEFTFLNEPEFLRRLFGIEIATKRVDRMVFLHRAAARGPLVLLRHLSSIFTPSEIRYAPDRLFRNLAVQLVPQGLKRLVRASREQ